MDYAILAYLVAAVAGFGGGGVVMSRASLVGYTPNPEDPPRKRCPFCPPILGAILAVILWAVCGAEIEMAGGLLTAGVLGFTAGTAGGTLSNLLVR